MRQPSLFEPTPPFQAHSETSREAAIRIMMTAENLRSRVYRFIMNKGEYGATDGEIQKALRMEGSTQRPRRVELQEKNLIKDSGIKRKTRSGRRAVVWVTND